MVKIRMARLGRPHHPFYRINAVDSRVKRDGVVIENLGWYDPMAKGAEKKMELNTERLKYWLSVGAQPTDTVKNFLADASLVNKDELAKHHAKRVESKKVTEAKKAALAAAGGDKKDKKK
jgi:small subunit ribosomal protein S16